MPVKVVSERMGHSSVAFTMQTYMHVIPGMDEQAAQVAAAAILGSPDDHRTAAVAVSADLPPA
jgi:precorrin-3B methylase